MQSIGATADLGSKMPTEGRSTREGSSIVAGKAKANRTEDATTKKSWKEDQVIVRVEREGEVGRNDHVVQKAESPPDEWSEK